jgi:hypothetical protein
MKRKILLFVAFAGMTAFSAAGQIVIQKAEKLRTIPPYIFGLCHPLASDINSQGEKLRRSKELNECAEELNIGHIRGPGGTDSNFFKWQLGKLFKSTDPDYKTFYGEKIVRLVENSSDDPQYRLTLDDCWNMPDYLNKPYVYCLNIVSDSDEDICTLVKELLKRSGSRPLFLELGNEIYSVTYQTKFPTVREYVTRCQHLAEMIKSIDKDIKVSVCSPNPVLVERVVKDPNNQMKDDGEFSVAGRLAAWRPALEKSQDYFDAVSVHYYNRIRKFDDKPNKEDAMEHFFAENQFFSQKMDAFAKSFPGKELWLTEWNVMNVPLLAEKDETQKGVLSVSKYTGTALVLSDLACRMMENESVSLTSFHNFYTANGFGLLNFKDRQNRDDTRKLPQFYAFEAIGEILKDNDTLYRPTLKGSETRHKLEGLDESVTFSDAGVYVFGNSEKPRKLLAINRTGKPKIISFDGYKLAEKWAYGSENPFPDYLKKKSYAWVDTPDNVPVPETMNGKEEESLTLPPWTMLVADISQ